MRALRRLLTTPVALALILLAIAGCRRPKDGDSYYGTSSAPPVVEPSDTAIDETEDLPGLNFTVVGVEGGSGDDGNFQSGDSVHVTFTVTRDDGSALSITEVDRLEVHISGPTFNYQRVIGKINVIPSIGEVPEEIQSNDDGSYTYEFPPLPDDYIDPPNYTAANTDGVLGGTPLVSGTYTLVLIGYKNYTVGGTRIYKDVANTTYDFLFGDVSVLEPREVVSQENCARCHDDLQYHTRGLPGGGRRKDVTACATCHVAGAEDWNDPAVAGGTPGVSVEFKVMIHKLHNGSHLPSVVGVGTTGGARDYTRIPEPYELVSDELVVLDFSAASFPWMPSAYFAYLFDKPGTTYTGTGGNGPMPRDVGYAALLLSQKFQEDKIRTGMVACVACHGDPDGAGPLAAPAQGDLATTQPTRNACGSCHDDVDWSGSYTSNGLTMPAQPDDSECITCHVGTADTLDTITAHTHPYTDTTLNPGVNLEITGVSPGSGVGGNYVAGDPVAVTFGVTDAAGLDVQMRTLTRFQMIVTGPMHNPQYILPGVDPRDGNWRKSAPFTGTGTISTPSVGAGALPYTLAVVCTGAAFDILDNSGPGGTVVTLVSGLPTTFGPVTYDGVTFSVTAGGTPFVAGDRWYFEIIPTAPSYTMTVPVDFTYERVGVGGGGPWTVSNLPLYWGRQSVRQPSAPSIGTTISAPTLALQQRYVIVDASSLIGTGIITAPGLTPDFIVGDVVVIDGGTANEEYLTIGRIQSTDDVTGADFGTADRMWFTLPMRYNHAAAAALQEVTLSTRREGTQYTLGATPSLGVITEVAGFTAGAPVLVSYRAAGRFGWRRAPGDPLQTYYQAPTFDSDDFDATWGEWKNLSLQSGTHKIGMWANRDFSVDPLRLPTALAGFTNGVGPNQLTDATTYRSISPAESALFLYGTATEIGAREIISSPENCNSCHGDLMFHGNGRNGLDTCLNCHTVPGTEDAAKYAYNSWYVTPTPKTTVDFRSMVHKLHRGHELVTGSTWRVNGVFLAVPYPFSAEEIFFPSMGGGTSNCEKCHGEMELPEEVQTWEIPGNLNHPMQLVPVREWRTVCSSCHDSSDASAHMSLMTDGTGEESCLSCHGPGDTYGVRVVHKVR